MFECVYCAINYSKQVGAISIYALLFEIKCIETI